MSITVDCFFKFLMCSCRAYIAGTATIDASSGHLKCWNWLALFAECNGNSVSFWRWSFYHFIWPSVIFPPSCHFFRSPFMASKTFLPFLLPAGFALVHFGTQRQGWWRQWPDMLRTFSRGHSLKCISIFPFFHEFELVGVAELNFLMKSPSVCSPRYYQDVGTFGMEWYASLAKSRRMGRVRTDFLAICTDILKNIWSASSWVWPTIRNGSLICWKRKRIKNVIYSYFRIHGFLYFHVFFIKNFQ